jgi:hypothetical protein
LLRLSKIGTKSELAESINQSVAHTITMIKHGQGRTNAERATEWRDKQKKEDPEFLAKEAKRKAQSKTELGTEEQAKLDALDLIFKSQSKQSKLSHGARAKEQKKLNRAQFRLVKALFTGKAAQPASRDD